MPAWKGTAPLIERARKRLAMPEQDGAESRIEPLAMLYARPGFKLRRAHQVALSVFSEECRAFDVTTTQYGILVALREQPGLDQIGLAQALGLDRSTTGMVAGNLETRGLLRRQRHEVDRRRHVLTLTAAGEELLQQIGPATERAWRRLLAPLSGAEAAALAALLDRLLSYHDALIRVPLKRSQDS
ncbi:MarR family winged helix-turn-helix transcriptional regulator [Pseudoroseomonas ludipueritiae]